MKTARSFYFKCLICTVILAASCVGLSTPQADNGIKVAVDMHQGENGIYYIELEGTPYEMGYAHGLAFKSQIQQAVDDYKLSVYKTFGEVDGTAIIDWALSIADFKNDVIVYSPDIFQEIEGIADGSEVQVDDIILLNMFEEIYEVAPLRFGVAQQRMFGFGCTLFQVQTDLDVKFCGQNADYSGNLNSKQLMIRYIYPDMEILMFGFVGRIGGIGVNSKGLSVFAATLPQGSKRETDGLGLNYILRLLLGLDSVDQAIETLRELPRFGSLCYSIADYSQSVMTESTSDEIILAPLPMYPGFQCHTNHMLWTDKSKRNDVPGIFKDGEPIPGEVSFNTLERLERADGFIIEAEEAIDRDVFTQMLTTEPINSSNPLLLTLESAIVEYDVEKISFHVSAGTDPQRQWNEYSFDDPVGAD